MNDLQIAFVRENFRIMGDTELTENVGKLGEKFTRDYIRIFLEKAKLRRTRKEKAAIKIRNLPRKRAKKKGHFKRALNTIYYKKNKKGKKIKMIWTEKGAVKYLRWLYEENFRKLKYGEIVAVKHGVDPDKAEATDLVALSPKKFAQEYIHTKIKDAPIGVPKIVERNGTIRIIIKTAKGHNKWKEYKRYLYEKNFGPIPKGHLVVSKKGTDPLNPTKDTIQCVSRKNYIAEKVEQLSDTFLAAALTRGKSQEEKELMLSRTGFLDARRQLIFLKRELKKHGSNTTGQIK